MAKKHGNVARPTALARYAPRRAAALVAPFALALWAACGSGAAPSPFAGATSTTASSAASGGAGGQGAGGGDLGGGGGFDPTLGGPCTADAQCDDTVGCTVDLCDLALERCRFTPDDSACQNGSFCDGVERCDQKADCEAGPPVSCGDTTVCTVDACDEATDLCTHALRDADQDGDPDVHCFPGKDCDDADPTRSSLIPEICGNFKDDDCDGSLDEGGCSTPLHDTCADPLDIAVPGSYAMDTTAAGFHYASTCGLPNQLTSRDVVAAILLPAGPLVDVEITARSPYPAVAVTIAGQCGDAATELSCGGSFYSPVGGTIAKARARLVGSQTNPTAYPVYVTTDQGIALSVDVQILAPEAAPTNETCGTAQPIVPGVPLVAPVLGTAHDLGSVCAYYTGELVYSFDLAAPQNVAVFATSVDGDGLPSVSLRGAGCALPSDEITCQTSASPYIFWQSLPAGTYYVAVGATAPTDVSVTVELSPATPPPPEENCVGSPVLAHNTTIDLDLGGHQDDLNLGCYPGAIDAAYQLDLAVDSDVLLVQRIAQGDTGAIELSLPACGPGDMLACFAGAPSPIRASKHDVAAGTYRVVAESFLAQSIQLTALVRPAVAPVLVPFADACADAFEIPKTGGLFQGNTSNATANYNAGCDFGGVPQGGANEQLLRLVLDATKRVVLDMGGSAYTTLLDVRQGPACPGSEVPLGCSVGYYQGRSFLDLTLAAGTYYIQIDGFNSEKGPWFLDVHVVDP